jgi:MFS family permease
LGNLQSLSASLKWNLFVLFCSGLLFWTSLATLLPTLPQYVDFIGGDKREIGFVMGAFAIGLLLSRPWLGQIADRKGRKWVLIIGMIAVAFAPLGYLSTQSIPLLMGIRVFHGLSIAAFATGYAALVADIAPIENRGELIGYMSLVNPIGVAIGPAAGGLLQEEFGFSPLFLLSFGLGIVGLICTAWVKEAARPPSSDLTRSNQVSLFSRFLFTPYLQTPTLVLLLVGLVFGILSTFVPLFIKASEVDLNPGFFYTAAAIASFGIRLLTGRASDQYGRGLFITISLSFYAAAMLVLSTTQSAALFLLAAVLEGAGSGILIPTIVALISDRSDPEERGRVFSFCLSGFDLGIAVAGPVLGIVAEQLGYQGLFRIATGLSLGALLLFITRSGKNLSHSWQFALGQARDVYALPRSDS